MALEKCLDPQLWHACAGGMVQIPLVDSKVCYFPEGHAEQAGGNVDFSGCTKIPALILCRVTSLKYMADRGSDEVFVRMTLVPIRANEPGFGEDDGSVLGGKDMSNAVEKPASFAKTLTQSDANNGGGFSVPRYCAETIFPRLDYSADPPVQTVLVKDVHDELWKFRHIYRGTPRRHLLTTGWSSFVNQKKLLAGDSVVFLRADNGDLCIGIRRAKRGSGDGVGFPPPWNQFANCFASYTGPHILLTKEEGNKTMKSNGSIGSSSVSNGIRMKGRVSSASVIEAATLAASGKPFEVVYYPRAGTPEFCVGASMVRDAMSIQWGSGMRFKMAFETEDSSRISWFMGTIAGTCVADPIRWPNSPWRFLQVAWDEPDLLQNVKSINPWLVELVPSISALHTVPFSPPLKKMCLAQQRESPSNEQISAPIYSTNSLLQSSSPARYLPGYAPAGIQGARHAQLDIPLTDLHQNKLQRSLFLGCSQGLDNRPLSTALTVKNTADDENVSHFLTMGGPSCSMNKSPKATHFVLFGKLIVTGKQLSSGSSVDTVSTNANSSSEGNTENSNLLDGSGSAIHQHDDNCSGSPPRFKQPMLVESENTLDVLAFNSPDKLQTRLGDLFWDREIGSSSWRALQRSS